MASKLIDIATARERVLAEVSPLETEQVELWAALGRVLAEDVTAGEDLPPFDSSAMDGYAVVAGPAGELALVGESRAGHPAGRALASGEAIAISTGAQIPEGADAVVPVERVELHDGRVSVPDTPAGNHVRRSGEDVHAGDVVLRAGSTLGPAELARGGVGGARSAGLRTAPARGRARDRRRAGGARRGARPRTDPRLEHHGAGRSGGTRRRGGAGARGGARRPRGHQRRARRRPGACRRGAAYRAGSPWGRTTT